MLERDEGNISSPAEVANILGEEFARHFSGASYSSAFQARRESLELHPFPFFEDGDGDADYNDTITLQELRAALPAAGTVLTATNPFLMSCFVDCTPPGRPFSWTYSVEFGPHAPSLAVDVRLWLSPCRPWRLSIHMPPLLPLQGTGADR